ncbi:hypothetical protein O3P69_011074 [Scylla paramamosain]|uniref:Uncharacterized protein n=1 Tax=Scylla paramamosain TaxID=85552 RepID=A0AAW0STA3_SCYPA
MSRCVTCVAVVALICITQVTPFPQDFPVPLRDSPRALLSRPYRPQNIQLASLVESFAQNDIGKGYMFDFNLPDTSELDKMPPLPSPPKFNINTFTFNEKNVRTPGDIFSLLADVNGAKNEASTKKAQTSTSGEFKTKQKSEASKLESESISDGATKKTAASSSSEAKTKQKTEASKLGSETSDPVIKIPGVEVVNTFGKKILMATQDFQNLMGVVQRMTKKVEAKLGNNTKPLSFSSPLNTNVSSLVSLLLDSSRLEEIRTAGLTAKTEDEFLDHLTSVLIGEETRGTALTLDPVTIIALLTLAAYLIRAVYQVLTVTGRSMEVADLMLPLHLSDVPFAMASIHDWISAPQGVTVREKRSVNHLVGNILDIPGSLAAIIKLYREGHRRCVKPFICEQMERRAFPEVTLTDMLISGLGYYFGEDSWGTFIDNTLTARSAGCDVLPVGCSARTLDDAHYLENIYTRASYKFFDLLARLTGLV